MCAKEEVPGFCDCVILPHANEAFVCLINYLLNYQYVMFFRPNDTNPESIAEQAVWHWQ